MPVPSSRDCPYRLLLVPLVAGSLPLDVRVIVPAPAESKCPSIRREGVPGRGSLCARPIHLFPRAATEPAEVRRAGRGRPEDLRVGGLRRMPHAAALHQQQADASPRVLTSETRSFSIPIEVD